MTREEAKKRLEVWLICGECPEDKQCYDSHLHSTCEYTDYCDEVSLTDAVKVAISALSENKGEWIFYDEEFYQQGRFASVHHRIRECSICHHKIADFVGDMNFCPNCGADMRGE